MKERKQDLSNPRNVEELAVRNYLENDRVCHRLQLLEYFDSSLKEQLMPRDYLLCCDVCAKDVMKTKIKKNNHVYCYITLVIV